MKPLKHAELIKAWADGAKIQSRYEDRQLWWDADFPCWIAEGMEFRIKPEPKPDVVSYLCPIPNPSYWLEQSHSTVEFCDKEKLKLTRDGETGKIKSVEVME